MEDAISEHWHRVWPFMSALMAAHTMPFTCMQAPRRSWLRKCSNCPGSLITWPAHQQTLRTVVSPDGVSDFPLHLSLQLEHPLIWFLFLADLQSKYSGSGSNLYDASKPNIYIYGPAGIHVYVTDEVLGNIKDESLFALEIINNKIVMKIVYKNEINWFLSSVAASSYGLIDEMWRATVSFLLSKQLFSLIPSL